MYNSRLFIFLLFVSTILIGQELVEKPPLDLEESPKWQYDVFSYADFGTGEQHSYFLLMYKMNPKLYSELRGFYDTYRGADIVDFSFRVKWYPTKKIYLFSGVGVQIQRPKVGQGLPITPMRLINGVGYEPKKNMSIEAAHDLNFKENTSSSLFRLKGKYRF